MYTTAGGAHHIEYLIDYINDIIEGKASPFLLIVIIAFVVAAAVLSPKMKKYLEQKFKDDDNAETKIKLIGLAICMLIAACFLIGILQVSM